MQRAWFGRARRGMVSLVLLWSVVMVSGSSAATTQRDFIALADSVDNRVVVIDVGDRAPRPVIILKGQGEAPGQFTQPEGAALDPQGNVWVADTLNHRLQVFDLRGNLLRLIGTWGRALGRFEHPTGLAIGRDGTVFVADSGNNRVQVLDPSGRVRLTFGTYGEKPGKFVEPLHVALDETRDRIYVIDMLARLQIFDLHGSYKGSWGSVGLEPGQMRWPSIAVAPDGTVYVSDESLQRVTRFDPSGRVLQVWGGHGTGHGHFYIARNIAVDSRGRVWVLDYGNGRIQAFTSEGKYLFAWGESIFSRVPSKRLFSPRFSLGAATLLLAVILMTAFRRIRPAILRATS